jgi:translin
MLQEELKKHLENIEGRLSDRFEGRERVLLLSREVIRLCGEVVSLSHRREKERAVERYGVAQGKVAELKTILRSFPELLYGDVGTAFQEMAEASVVLALYFDVALAGPEELGIPEIYYVTGIADAVGEMRRTVLEFLRKGKLNEAEQIYDIMEGLYEMLWRLEYPKSLVPGLRQKIDGLRKILEETNHDLFLAGVG